MPNDTIIAKYRHPKWGLCDLVRVEATDWIVRFQSTGRLYRFPSEMRTQFEPTAIPRVSSPAPIIEQGSRVQKADGRRLRRAIESLRTGLPTLDGTTRQLAVGFRQMERQFGDILLDIDLGGRAAIIKGAYGHGKTFAMRFLEEMALEKGFITARVEIDAVENRLNKPHHIYRNLIRNLRLPGAPVGGPRPLAERASLAAAAQVPTNSAEDRYKWFEKHTGCFPLSWLLSDPRVAEKIELLGLLGCDPNVRIAQARAAHAYHNVSTYSNTKYWPSFSAGTMGDFASYILSGIGRLSRLIGCKGCVLILDEMEKWQELNWREQAQAGNLLGGLIWGATAERRGRQDHPLMLTHSRRWGGFPFTTSERSHLGIAIAMTPRGNDDPERTWAQYGLVEVLHLPELDSQRLIEYCGLVAPRYAAAFGLSSPEGLTVEAIAAEAVTAWATKAELTIRSGVQSVIAALDHWRDQLTGSIP